VRSPRRREDDCATRLEIEVTFEIRSFCDCCDSELEWRKEFVEVDISLEMDRIKLWFESGAAVRHMRRLLQASVPPVDYLKTLSPPKKRARRRP
jgi:hypothetical protein